jgi:DNA repair exonuclease SbcCD ATPase subunit
MARNRESTMNQGGRNDSTKVALAYIESLTARFENTEKHINDDIEAIEKRLNQLVDLMASVSTMQQQVSNQQQVLNELRVAVRENLAQIEELLGGIDTRYAAHFDALKKKMGENNSEQSAARKKVEQRVDSLESKLQTWLNRGIGGWAVFVLVIGFFQYVGMQYIGALQHERDAAQATIAKNSARISDLELRQQNLEDQLHYVTTRR